MSKGTYFRINNRIFLLLDRDMPYAGDRGGGSSCEIGQAREKYELEIGCRCEKCEVRSVRGIFPVENY